MILVLDLGNTNLFMGVYDEKGSLLSVYRKHSDINKSSDEYKDILKTFLMQDNYDLDSFEGAILSSVIPSLTDVIKKSVEKVIKKTCLVVGKNLKSGLPIRTDNPNEVGTDLICDAVGAMKKYGYPCIVADLGTATKLSVVDNKGAFIGVVIAPGVKVGMRALVGGTAQLVDVSFTAPKNVVGKNTPDSLNSGAIYGTIAQIEGLADKIEKELGYKTQKIITGGYAPLMIDNLDKSFIFDENLILDGLFMIYVKNVICK